FKHSRGFLGLISAGNALQLDHITAVDGKPVKDVDSLRTFLNGHMGQTMTLDLKRTADEVDVMTIQPLASFNERLMDPESDSYNLLFIANTDGEIIIKHNALESVFIAINETASITWSTLEALGQMVV